MKIVSVLFLESECNIERGGNTMKKYQTPIIKEMDTRVFLNCFCVILGLN